MSATVLGQTADILVGSKLFSGLDMGVNSSGGKTNWLSNDDAYMTMSYPASQSWGSVFITVGKPKEPPRPKRDMSAYDMLTVEMKGATGGEQIEIGLKTNTQPDDGSETKVPIKLTSDWQTYRFSLDKFTGIDLTRVYVLIEFVFSGTNSQTVQVRNVKYLSTGGGEQSQGLGSSPNLRISYPEDHYGIHIWSGDRPSILVKGTACGLSQEDRLVLVVHPRNNDLLWQQEVPVVGTQWLANVHLGDLSGLPRNNDEYEVFAAVTQTQPPNNGVSLKDLPLSCSSNILTVKVDAVSWFDRVVAYGSNLQVSGPFTALIAGITGITTLVIGRKQGKRAASEQK
ncbi:MAG: hypothetical protein A2007_01040 [Verrucomicrobia bacterium GWC2_42_7]|nr:MAG: hypothetical protein A2007_01040 [Verrucomicrobia bacterium GWC2_42_7]